MVERTDPEKTVVERTDPARTGVRAGGVVGVLTAALATVALFDHRGSFREATTTLLDVFGVEATVPVAALFWGNVLVAASARYTACYVVGSLVGVVYDWVDEGDALPVAAVLVFVVGVCDGALAAIDTRSTAFGAAYVLAWLCYLPAFVWLSDEDADDDRTGARRLGES